MRILANKLNKHGRQQIELYLIARKGDSRELEHSVGSPCHPSPEWPVIEDGREAEATNTSHERRVSQRKDERVMIDCSP